MRRCALLLVAVALLGAAGASHAQLLGLGWRGREMGSCTAQAPPMPAGLKASVLAEGSVSLSWAAGDAAAPPPTGPACISGYSILVMASGQTAKDGKKFTTKVRQQRRGGCSSWASAGGEHQPLPPSPVPQAVLRHPPCSALVSPLENVSPPSSISLALPRPPRRPSTTWCPASGTQWRSEPSPLEASPTALPPP